MVVGNADSSEEEEGDLNDDPDDEENKGGDLDIDDIWNYNSFSNHWSLIHQFHIKFKPDSLIKSNKYLNIYLSIIHPAIFSVQIL